MCRTHQTLFGMTALLLSLSVSAQGERSGEQVYRQACFSCHATQFDKAPQFGDKKAWRPLIAEGQHVLTAHAWVGVRGMPAQGGQPDLGLQEFANATAYMVRASGGDWPDVDAVMFARIKEEESKRRAELKAKEAAKAQGKGGG